MLYTFSLSSKGVPQLHFEAIKIYEGPSIEKFKVYLKGGQKPVVVQCNRPYLLAHHLDVPLTWQLVDGYFKNKKCFDVLTTKLSEVIKSDLPHVPPLEQSLFEA